MMALATSTLVNGEWTTQTLDVNSVLQHYDQQDKEAATKFSDVERPPVHGLLTQTIIRSPQAHWILPVKIRNPHANDVAFIGEDFVQIRELRPDGHLCDIIRKENFGAKIHNARVIGSIKAYYEDPDTGSLPPKDIARDGDNDISMGGTPRAYPQSQGLGDTLPPQTIVLHLDSGDFCFLMLREEKNVGLKFVSTRHRVSKPMLTSPIIKPSIFKPSESTTDKTFSKLFGESASKGSPLRESPSRASLSALQAGMHLAVDPSSRYMAIGCSQDIFAIYELHTRGDLKEQQAKGTPLRHIESERYITFPGVIHKMEFLYPSADDEGHIILVILVVRAGQTRMVVFEWQAGMDLRKISAHSKKGHLLEEARRMPLLLIPLTIKSAFILVSESSMAVCQDILSGSPRCVDFNTEFDPPTSLHYGLGPPLWVAWTRPPRLGYHTAFRDDLYIAREDGLVKFFEIDSEEFVNAEINISHFQCNVGTALASVEYQKFNDPGRSGDLLITGGDSCVGGTYLVRAREYPQFTETVHNWSPAIDFVTTFSTQDLHRQRKGAIPSSDRIFVCNGMGTKGAISEFRYGLEAAVGTIIPYDTPIMKAWVLSPSFDLTMEGAGLLFLMSLGNCSAMVKLSSDASQAEAVDSESTLFDLESRTIAVGAFGNLIRQVTERSIIVSNGDRAHIHNGKSLLDMATAVENAVIYEDVVLYTTLFGNEAILRVLTPESTQAQDRFDSAMHGESIVTLQRFSSRITSLALCLVGQHLCAIVAAWGGEFIELTFQPINGAQSHTLQLPTRVQKGATSLDAIISMVVAPGTSIPGARDSIVLLCGTRNGFVVTLDVIVEDTVRIIDSRCDRFGVTSAFITKDEPQFRPTIIIKEDGSQKCHDSYFVSCGSSMCTITPGAPHPKGYESTEATLRRGRRVEQIWLTDALKPTLQQPEIVSVVRIPDIFGGTEGGNLLVVAGSDLILARLSPQQKAVPRHLSIQGTPKRVLYSHDLQVLIVAAIVNGRTTLLFIDPDTGEDLSKAVDKTGAAVECDPGLGKPNETILGLLDWPFSKDGRLWRYLVITTSSGRVLLISYEKETGLTEEASTTKPRICFRTRFKFKHTDPVSAVTGVPEGIIYCSGNTLYCEFLDRDEKKFRRVAQYKLSSPARSLTVRDDTIYAMTAAHSLEVLRFERGLNGDASKIIATHFDQNHRFGLHHLEISGSDSTGVGVQLSLVTDKDTSVAGLWATSNAKADTLDTVFEAEMQSSIQKLRIGRCRPIWDPVWALEAQLSSGYPQPPPSGTQAALGDQYSVSVLDGLDIVRTFDSETEILGLTMDGSLNHFTILGETAWSFLRLIQNMAMRSPIVCQFTYDSNFEIKPSLNPKTMMHVNGDILKRVLEERMLAHLLSITRTHTLFAGVLNNLHRREPGLLAEMEKDPSLYVEQAYADLEYYLRPVL